MFEQFLFGALYSILSAVHMGMCITVYAIYDIRYNTGIITLVTRYFVPYKQKPLQIVTSIFI